MKEKPEYSFNKLGGFVVAPHPPLKKKQSNTTNWNLKSEIFLSKIFIDVKCYRLLLVTLCALPKGIAIPK